MLKLSPFKSPGWHRTGLAAGLLVLVITLAPAPHARDDTTESQWEQKGKKYGVTLYYRDYPNSSLPEFRARVIIEASMASVLGVLLDIELGGNLPGWIVRGKIDDLAYQTLRGLRRQSKKPAYQDLQLSIENQQLSVIKKAD